MRITVTERKVLRYETISTSAGKFDCAVVRERKVLGRRTLLIYIGSITIGAIIFGLGIDYLLPREWFTAPIQNMVHTHDGGTSWFRWFCTIAMGLLLLNAMILRFMHRGHSLTSERMIRQYRITGLRCNRCKENAEKAISGVDGVESVSIDLASGVAEIKGNPDADALKQAVEALGFRLE